MLLNDVPEMPAASPEPAKAEAPKADAPKAEVKKEEVKSEGKKVYELNIKGKKVMVPEEEVTAWLQKAVYADEVTKKATQSERAVATLIERLKSDPWAVLSDPSIGHDAKELSVNFIKSLIEEEKLDPKDRELRLLKKKTEELENFKKSKTEQEEKEKTDAEVRELSGRIRTELIKAIEDNKLPKTQTSFDRMIEYMRAYNKKFGKELPASKAAEFVKKDLAEELKARLVGMTPEEIASEFGEDLLSKIQKVNLEKLKLTALTPKKEVATKTESKRKSGGISEREWEEGIKKLL